MRLEPGGRAIALMYHDVIGSGATAPSGFEGAGAEIYKLDRDEFAAHLSGLQTAPATVDGAGFTHGDANGRWPVFLTFDDGGVSADTEIAPLLEARGWRGLFFVTTDRIGTPGFLDAHEIRNLAARGHVIGSHSCSHPRRISDCTESELRHEWADSIDALAQIIGARVETASVPGGFYSRSVGQSAARAGIRVLFTSEPTMRIRQVDGCLLVGRYGVWRGMAPETTGRIAAGERMPRWRQTAWWTIKKTAKSLPGDPYMRVRAFLLARRASST